MIPVLAVAPRIKHVGPDRNLHAEIPHVTRKGAERILDESPEVFFSRKSLSVVEHKRHQLSVFFHRNFLTGRLDHSTAVARDMPAAAWQSDVQKALEFGSLGGGNGAVKAGG